MQVYKRLFTDTSPQRIDQLFNRLDHRHTGYVDYLEWSRLIDLKDVPNIVKKCRHAGPLTAASLTEHEYLLLKRMMRRLHDLADAAQRVRLLHFSMHLTGPDCVNISLSSRYPGFGFTVSVHRLVISPA